MRSICTDEWKNATRVILQNLNEKVQLEEDICIAGEPGNCHLTHLSSQKGRGRTVAEEMYKTIHGTKLHDEIVSGGTDGAASMTG